MTLPPDVPVDRRKFRWDPTVNMGHIITMVSSFVSTLVIVMVAYANMDKRVAVLEQAQAVATEQRKERDAVIREKVDDLKSDVKDVKSTVELLRQEVRNIKP